MGSEGRRRIGITEKPVNTFCKDAKSYFICLNTNMVQLWACPTTKLH